MSAALMCCAYCGTRLIWPDDFPLRTEAVCRPCGERMYDWPKPLHDAVASTGEKWTLFAANGQPVLMRKPVDASCCYVAVFGNDDAGPLP